MSSFASNDIIKRLNASWIWISPWVDSSEINTAGSIVNFNREVTVVSKPCSAILHFSADTRYKLYVNGNRVAVGPSRSGPSIWYYDSLDIAKYLRVGANSIKFVVVRYFSANRAAMPFERTSFPGLTVSGSIKSDIENVLIESNDGNWTAYVDKSTVFPMGTIDDGFLHISERVSLKANDVNRLKPTPYNFKTLNGDLLPWRLRERPIPMPEETKTALKAVRNCQSALGVNEWMAVLSSKATLLLPAQSRHILDIEASAHSTAFLSWTFGAAERAHIDLKATYSEGYELEPRSYPFFRKKMDRLDHHRGTIIGPFDQVSIDIEAGQEIIYEPFWFRTFRVIRFEILVGSSPAELKSFTATQTNYPLRIEAAWSNPADESSQQIWEVSIRTLRNCMFDGYSDCPFYEQLQYSMDSRAVGLFHYLLCGDDRLMRQGISNFGASITSEGLTQSRYPSHVNQLIAAFPLYWILQICDHHLFFGDAQFARSFLPRIDGVLEFFESYVDGRGLISGLPDDVWQFVDWVTTWHATEDHPDKGVPMSGRKSNLHTYFSMVLAYVLQEAANLLRQVGRPGHSDEYEFRAQSLRKAVKEHCYDGRFYTDSTADVADELSYSQHCQVWAVLSGVATQEDRERLLLESFGANSSFSKCSYMMQFYALRAFALAGDGVYEQVWPHVLDPWRDMLVNNLSTWEEDDVRQRSDCHAWGSVPIYEFCVEVAGVFPIAPGSSKIMFKPRLMLTPKIRAKVALGNGNLASVHWEQDSTTAEINVTLRLRKPVEVTSRLPRAEPTSHGVTSFVTLRWIVKS